MPYDAQLYFLAERKNPFWFFNTEWAVNNAAQWKRVQDIFEREPPSLVIYCPWDKRNTIYSAKIRELVRARYQLIQEMDGFEIYQYVPPF